MSTLDNLNEAIETIETIVKDYETIYKDTSSEVYIHYKIELAKLKELRGN